MTFRKAIGSLPLAVSVAVLAHLVAFGFVHAPGAERSAELFVALAVALGFGLFGAFISGALGTGRVEQVERERWFAPLLLAAGGTLTFAGIELSEGYLPLQTVLTAAAASIPLAYLVAFVSRSARCSARTAGARCARIIGHVLRVRATTGSAVSRALRRACASTVALAVGTPRGRAPPVLF